MNVWLIDQSGNVCADATRARETPTGPVIPARVVEFDPACRSRVLALEVEMDLDEDIPLGVYGIEVKAGDIQVAAYTSSSVMGEKWHGDHGGLVVERAMNVVKIEFLDKDGNAPDLLIAQSGSDLEFIKDEGGTPEWFKVRITDKTATGGSIAATFSALDSEGREKSSHDANLTSTGANTFTSGPIILCDEIDSGTKAYFEQQGYIVMDIDWFKILYRVVETIKGVLRIQSLDFFKPETSGWEEADKLLWEEVISRDEGVRFNVKLTKEVPSVDDLPFQLVLTTSDTKPEGEAIPLDAPCVQFVNNNELRITLTGNEVVTRGLLPGNTEDGVDEFTTADLAGGEGGNHNDGDAFDTRMDGTLGWQRRGKARDHGSMLADPPESSVCAEFVKAGGVQYIRVLAGIVRSEPRQIQDQADYFYFSGHGYHDEFTFPGRKRGELGLDGGLNVNYADIGTEWAKDMDVVIVAGCSVLDINDYNDNYTGAAHTTSPGEGWATTGPKLFFGYNWKAPLDDNIGDPDFTKKIVDKYHAKWSAGTTEVLSWMNANKEMASTIDRAVTGQRPWNACVIDMRGAGKYWFFDYNDIDEQTGEPQLNFVLKADW